MIIDSHTHIFYKWLGDCGLPKEIHLKYIQKNMTHPSAKVFRSRDGVEGDPQQLYRHGDESWEGLYDDIKFRIGPYGRIEFTVEGEDYYIQYMPVAMMQIESTPEFMISQMNVSGVSHCILQAGFTYGYMNDYNSKAQKNFPKRFTGLMHTNEPMADKEFWMQEMQRAKYQLGLEGIYFSLEGFSRYGFRWWFDDFRFNAFWEMIASFNIPVFIELSSIPSYDQIGYENNLSRLEKIMIRHPDIRWLLVMGPPVKYYANKGKWHFSEIAQRVYSRETVQLEICFPIMWGGVWEYPFLEAQNLIKDLRDKFGVHKLIWGSDMPNLERFCTYKQGLDYILKHSKELNSNEKDQILGGNLMELIPIFN